MRSGRSKGVFVKNQRKLHIRYCFHRFYGRQFISCSHRRSYRRCLRSQKEPSSALGVLPASSILSSSDSNSVTMPRKTRDERPLFWSPAAEAFLLEKMYEYHEENHSRLPETRHYNHWATQMAKYFDGYVPDGERLKEKRRRLGKLYAAYKMLQDHTGVGWDPSTSTFTCSEELQKDLCKRNRDVKTLFTSGWKLNEAYMAAIFPTRIGASGLGAFHPNAPEEAADDAPIEDLTGNDEQQQASQDAPYQNLDDEDARNDLSERVNRYEKRNVTNIASSSRGIRKRQSTARKSNSSSKEMLVSLVKEMRDEMKEEIRTTKETLPSYTTVDGPSEADIILNSLGEMGIDKRTQTHAFDRIMASPTWRPVWGRIDEDMRRTFISDFVEVPQAPLVHHSRDPYGQPSRNFPQVPNPYNQPPNPYNHPHNPYNQPPNPYNQPPHPYNQPPNPYNHPPTP